MSASVTPPLGVLKNDGSLPGLDVDVCSDLSAGCSSTARLAADSVASVDARKAPVPSEASAACAGTAPSTAATSTYTPRAKLFLDRLTSTSLTVLQRTFALN